MKAILLAGGKGTRLRPMTVHTPKPIVPIFNRPFLYYQIDLLRQVPEIDEVILSLNYQPRRIEEIFGEGERPRRQAPLRGRADAARHRRAPIRYAGDSLTESVVVFNGDVLTQVDLARRAPAAPRAEGEGDHRADAGGQPPRLRAGRDRRATATSSRFLEKPGEDEITCNTINAGIYVLEPETFDRIPKDTAWSIERSFFPSLIERGETFVALRLRRLLDRHRHAGEIHAGAPRHHGRPLLGAAVRRHGRHRRGSSPDARVEEGVELHGPVLRRRGRGAEGGRAGAALLGHRTADPRGRRRRHRRFDHLAERVDRPRSRRPGRHPRPQLPHRTQCRHREPGACSATRPLSRTTADYDHASTPSIFKAYDVRGLYPSEVNEDAARLIGRGFVSYLQAKRIAVSRDMRLSSPSVAAAFIDGARAQGADVVDYGMMGTDMMYFAVARDGHDGGAQITASHNPKEYNGIKLVRREAFPLSGEAGIGDIRDMIVEGTLPPPAAARGGLSTEDVIEDYVEHVLSFIDPAIVKPFNVVLDAGTGIAGMVAPKLFDRLPCKDDALCFEVDGTFPEPRSEPADRREPPRHRRARDRETKADIGIAWDGDADRCFFIDGSGDFIAGDFVTALLAEAFLLKHPAAKVVYDVRASYAVKDIVAKYGGTALMNRVGHAFFKRRMREEGRDFRRRGHRALLLPGQLLRRQRVHPCAADPRADVAQGADAAGAAGAAPREVFHLGRDQHAGQRHDDVVQEKIDGVVGARTPTAGSMRSTASRRSSQSGTSTSARRTPSRCCG